MIATSLAEGFATEREKRIQANLERERQRNVDDPDVTKVYLITFGGHALGLPDADGRVVLDSACYAEVTHRSKGDPPLFGGQRVNVIARGDGRRLAKPYPTIITGTSVTSMVEVDPAILK